ncbi:VOC family protein [Protaetiibacter mangrovi]|uniref:VOC family protein n=1 Tax=Protaetiibacter mangrovi TaxID=2970926 RepID=A0ABT1ZIN3_9MICO|nr:VOC family protein [Protaetiibacter mangrovi]MCS0500543.1 VOC family protein [Protaetiibacter mangrovi]TPX03467.1 VOC family protein [Schumannella luteola]
MLTTVDGFSGFSVDDIDAALAFYRDTLGIDATTNEMGAIDLRVGGASVFVYPKPDHEPAGFTVLNFVVPDIDAAVDELVAAGVELERYEGMPQDERGVMRGRAAGQGPDIAWFTDPAGNVFSVIGA